MRWFWIDRFESFVSGKEATTLKNVTLSEEPLDDYLPGYPHYPHSLIIEGMAQTGGLLISQKDDFTQRIVLAKINKALFYDIAEPGDQLRLKASIVNLQTDGAIVEGEVTLDGQPFASMELTFAILDESYGKESFFNPGDFARILRSMRLFEVGVFEDGRPIQIPAAMLEAELLEKPLVSNSPLNNHVKSSKLRATVTD
jgi:3-hydroxyacyl-[acyl-carrier-protein] dehydratase